jgi:hypothetical protein
VKFPKPSAKTLDRAASMLPDVVANVLLAPLRRTYDVPCTCGQADCPGKNDESRPCGEVMRVRTFWPALALVTMAVACGFVRLAAAMAAVLTAMHLLDRLQAAARQSKNTR